MSKSKHENTNALRFLLAPQGIFGAPHCKEVSPSEDSCCGLRKGGGGGRREIRKVTEVCPKPTEPVASSRPTLIPGSGPWGWLLRASLCVSLGLVPSWHKKAHLRGEPHEDWQAMSELQQQPDP